MYNGFYEEGDICPECGGVLNYPPVKNCTCFISAPCPACVDNKLTCEKCGFVPQEPKYKDIPIAPCLSVREYKPRPLDKTKVDYRIKAHTSSTMICEGVYPEGATMADVEKIVRGTFGGRFEHFSNGEFKYIAYTD